MSKSFKSLLGVVAMVSALLFSAVAVGQYLFLSYQLRQRATDELSDLTEGMKRDIAFNDSWNLLRVTGEQAAGRTYTWS
jgi:hypothetical protein